MPVVRPWKTRGNVCLEPMNQSQPQPDEKPTAKPVEVFWAAYTAEEPSQWDARHFARIMKAMKRRYGLLNVDYGMFNAPSAKVARSGGMLRVVHPGRMPDRMGHATAPTPNSTPEEPKPRILRVAPSSDAISGVEG